MGGGGIGIGGTGAMGGGMGVGTSGGAMTRFMALPTGNVSGGTGDCSIPTQEGTTEEDKGGDVHNTEA